MLAECRHTPLVFGPCFCVLAFYIQQGRLCTVGADLGHELVRDKLVKGWGSEVMESVMLQCPHLVLTCLRAHGGQWSPLRICLRELCREKFLIQIRNSYANSSWRLVVVGLGRESIHSRLISTPHLRDAFGNTVHWLWVPAYVSAFNKVGRLFW